MNERIRKLKHQASLWCDENIPDQYSEETNGYGSAWEDKFAELIVRECAKEAFEFWCNQVDCNEDSAQSHIKKHFGVI